MIQAAMMFALGFSVCALIALALSSALARRTRRLAEERVKRRYATKRQEFETERDEIRARHAIDVQRLEREVRHLGDEATAYRLDAAIKDIEINALTSELDDKEDAIEDLSARLEALHDEIRENDRKLAETGTALRAARHALQIQANEEALGRPAEFVAVNGGGTPPQAPAADTPADTPAGPDASDAPADTQEAKQIRNVADEIRRIADETEAEILHLPVSDLSTDRAGSADSARSPQMQDGSTADQFAVFAMTDPDRRELPPIDQTSPDVEDPEAQIRETIEQIQKMKSTGDRSAAE